MWAWSQSREGAREEGASLSREELLAGGLAASLQASLLLATLLPVYTLQQGRQLLEYHALPAARILLEWLVAHPAVLRSDLTLLLLLAPKPVTHPHHYREKGFTCRPQIWPGLARLLNEVTPLLRDWEGPGALARYPLPEDWDLQVQPIYVHCTLQLRTLRVLFILHHT